MSAHQDTATRAPPVPGWAALWFGVVGGQAAWGAAVLVSYPTVAAVCEAGASSLWVHGVRWTALVIALAATAVARANWLRGRRPPTDVPERVAARVRFLGLGGMLLSASGAFLLLVEDLATWVIDPCL